MGAVAAVQPGMGANIDPQPFIIEEDSTCLKVISGIPILGGISSYIQDYSLAQKTELFNDPARLIEIIKVKNHYKVANIIRGVICIALIISGIALGIISKGLGIFVIIIKALNISDTGNAIAFNKGVISELKIKGFRQGLMVN